MCLLLINSFITKERLSILRNERWFSNGVQRGHQRAVKGHPADSGCGPADCERIQDGAEAQNLFAFRQLFRGYDPLACANLVASSALL